MRILIMGLPGSGKTTLAAELSSMFFTDCLWLNADDIREKYNDWDFSLDGRIRQSRRIRQLADESVDNIVIADFVCPLKEMRNIYEAHLTIWMDTIDKSVYEDTNILFEKPERVDFHITEKYVEKWSEMIYNHIIGMNK